MKTLFLEARAEKIALPQKVIDALPGNVALVSTVQFLDSLPDIRKSIERSGRRVTFYKGGRSAYEGQMLGCDVIKVAPDIDGILYIGDGMFHPKMLALMNEKPVSAYRPGTGRLDDVGAKDIERIAKRKKGMILKFLSSSVIGVMVTVKPGQHFADARAVLEKRYPDKRFYTFICDTIDFGQLDNFPFIEVWLNTACPRIGYDDSTELGKPIINMSDVMSL